MSLPTDRPQSGADLMRQFLPSSPFVKHLGIRLVDLQPDSARLALPFSEALITIGTTVHGGAIASLIDTATMVAAWSGAEVPDNMRGVTVSLTVTYLPPPSGRICTLTLACFAAVAAWSMLMSTC